MTTAFTLRPLETGIFNIYDIEFMAKFEIALN